MKEMIYQKTRLNPPEQIAKGNYNGFDYYVLNLGTHPCAYIDVADTNLNGKEYDEIDIYCHGGLTYSESTLTTTSKTGWFIGWDYAHCNDYSGYYTESDGSLYRLKRWTTQEMVNECKEVIDQIVKLLKGGQTMDELKITIHIEVAPGTEIIGIKEDFAAYCEKFGDVRMIEVEADE